MTSVGYGNIVASTEVGRIFAIFIIVNGAWLLALQIGLILQWFELTDLQVDTINNITETKLSVKVIKLSMKLNILKKKRARMLND